MRARCSDRGQTPARLRGGRALRPRRPPPARSPRRRGFCHRRGYRGSPESRSHTRCSATVARGHPLDDHWRGYYRVWSSHNKDTFSWDSNAYGYPARAVALAWMRLAAVVAVAGQRARVHAHTPHSGALSQQFPVKDWAAGSVTLRGYRRRHARPRRERAIVKFLHTGTW